MSYILNQVEIHSKKIEMLLRITKSASEKRFRSLFFFYFFNILPKYSFSLAGKYQETRVVFPSTLLGVVAQLQLVMLVDTTAAAPTLYAVGQ